MNKNGFDFDACKKKWSERGYLVLTNGRYSSHESFRGVKAYYVKLNQIHTDPDDDKPNFTELENDDLPFSMDGEQMKL